ncbi:MAG: N-(5'-phosphoribosyl)anthranilate isomerase [Candidatus Bathyarchaeia archaeon]
MRRVRVKICGITRKKDLTLVVAAGADAVGFIVGVAASPRNLTLDKAENLMKHVPIFVEKVVVTTTKNINFLMKIYERLRPNSLQMHGESMLDISIVRKNMPNIQVIKAIKVKDSNVKKADLKVIEPFDAVLLDSFVQGREGGTGIIHDWKSSKRIKQAIHPKPLILAGGLKPENVQEAILVVQPYAVDVSSGVELRPGIKDSRKVFAFINNAKEVIL